MSTKGLIGVKTKEGWKVVSNHWDSYPECLGKTLYENYITQEEVEELVNLGDLETVDATIDDTVAYGRDFGESDTSPEVCKSLKDVYEVAGEAYADFVYLFDEGKWEAYEVADDLVLIKDQWWI